MGLYLAMDGGGTKTRAWLADESRVLARAETGTVKLMNVAEDVATERLQALVRAVGAGVDLKAVTATSVGLAGSSSEAVRAWLRATLGLIVGGTLDIVGDDEIALDAAFRGGPGILVIAGTGSNVVGRAANGRRVTAGGWGPVLGDEGSGYWIGLEAVRAALRALDRREATCVLDAVLEAWGLRDVAALVARGNGQPRPQFGELVPVVVRCAEQGDVLAVNVLERAGAHLAAGVRQVAEQMGVLEVAVAYTGSVLEHVAQVRKVFVHALSRALPGAVVAEEAVEAIEGALWRARFHARA